ncbi:hypothetical protein J4050_04785 [Winogradskyella sp. DF17]|uniref:Anti-sigma factor n=1 Tax=Winogradskyella pelagia TaxID=2819984 RepID=A0ABS3T2U8_9FLAO|nr:hypothetical protein [Winogradskyella sp. DF17]MBO3116050.1 hypothetical protein [Winogradskyella sp. DF17]
MKEFKLHNGKSSGHKVPKDYFETLENRLMPKLNQIEGAQGVKTAGFKVPKDYFDKIEEQILDKVKQDSTPVVQLSMRKKLYYVAGIAAALVIAFSVFLNRENPSSISVEMVETYFQDSNLNSYEIAELLTEADFLQEDFNLLETEYNEDNLENYLLENADLQSILE